MCHTEGGEEEDGKSAWMFCPDRIWTVLVQKGCVCPPAGLTPSWFCGKIPVIRASAAATEDQPASESHPWHGSEDQPD